MTIPSDPGGIRSPPPPPSVPPRPKVQKPAAPPQTGHSIESSYKGPAKPKYAPVTPVDPSDGPEIPGSTRAAVKDAAQVVDALNQRGTDAAAAKLKQLILSDAALHDPDHANYATALTGALAEDLAKSLDNDPKHASAIFKKYLAAVPASTPEARANLVITAVNAAKTPAARAAIVSAAGPVMQQQAVTPDALQVQLDIVKDPATRSALATEAAPAIAEQVKAKAGKDPRAAADLLGQYLAALPASSRAAVATQASASLLAELQSKAKSDPAGAAKALDQLVGALPDVASRTAVLKAAAPAIQAIVTAGQTTKGILAPESAGQWKDVNEALRSLSHAAQLAGPAGTQAVTDAMAKAISARPPFLDPVGEQTNPWLAAVAKNTSANGDVLPLALSLRSSLAAAGDSVDASTLDETLNPLAASALEGAKGSYDAAQKKVDADNETLATELQRLGPGLSDAQKNKYVAAFHQKHAADYAAEEQAAARLGTTLTHFGPQLLHDKDPGTARAALDAANALAKTPSGAEGAKDFVQLALSHPESPLTRQLSAENGGAAGLKAKLEGVLKTAIPNLMAKDVADHHGDTGAATSELKEQLEQLETAKYLGADANAIAQGLNDLSHHDLEGLAKLGEGPLGTAFKGAGLILGIAGATQDSDLTDYVHSLALTGSEGAELIAQATRSLSATLPAAADAGELIGKFAPGLSVVANALQTSKDFQALLHGGGAGALVSTLGDAIATFGSALSTTGIGEIFGAPLQVIGNLVSLIGNAISGDSQEDAWNEEEKEFLGQIGLGAQAQALSSVDAETLASFKETSGLSTAEVQQLAKSHPDLFESGDALTAFGEQVKALGIKPADALGLADVEAKQGDYKDRLQRVYDALHNPDNTADPVSIRENYTSALSKDAQQYVLAHGGDTVGPDGQQRLNADYDLQVAIQSDGMAGKVLATALLFNKSTNPAYQAEIVKQYRQYAAELGQSLPDVIRQAVQDGASPQNVQAALLAAKNEGVLSASDYAAASQAAPVPQRPQGGGLGG